MSAKKKPKGKLTSNDPQIQKALDKATELERKKLPEEKDILKQDKEFRKDSSRLKKLLRPLWFLNKVKK